MLMIIYYLIGFLCSVIILLIGAGVLFTKILLPYKKATHYENPQDLLDIFVSFVKVELETYEETVFENIPLVKDSQFENYYLSIVRDIMRSYSDEFLEKLYRYITPEAVMDFVCSLVRKYLFDKIAQSVVE